LGGDENLKAYKHTVTPFYISLVPRGGPQPVVVQPLVVKWWQAKPSARRNSIEKLNVIK
jgi:hypothetical protein